MTRTHATLYVGRGEAPVLRLASPGRAERLCEHAARIEETVRRLYPHASAREVARYVRQELRHEGQ